MIFRRARPRRGLSQRRKRRGAEGADAARRVSASTFLLALLAWLSALVLVYSRGAESRVGLAVGQRAPFTVVAAVDFTCVDVAHTEMNRRQAANAVPPVFTVNSAPLNTAVRSLEKLFDQIIDIHRREGREPVPMKAGEGVGQTLELLDVLLTPSEALQLAPPGREEEVLEAIKAGLRETWAAGIISPTEKETWYQGIAAAGAIMIADAEGPTRGTVEISALPLPDEALELTVKRIVARVPSPAPPRRILSTLLRPWLIPNLLYDPRMTDALRRETEEGVASVAMKVRSGTTLVEAGERITPQLLEQLRAHDSRLGQLESTYDRAVKRIGHAGLLVAALIACIGLMQILSPGILRQESTVLALVAVSLLGLLPARGVLYFSETTRLIPPAIVVFALPLALAPLLASILAGGAAAVTVGLWNSFAIAVLFDNSFSVFALGMIATVTASLATRDIRKRAQIYRAGLFVGLATTLFAISVAATNQLPVRVVLLQTGAGLAGGMLCALATALLIPLFEWAFGITTNLTLLELTDLGHPVLQRLAMEAPGTYQHSIVTANLAQAAAGRIGANALLVRVASYFHDIGKLVKPEFFVENMRLRNNPHDELTPSMSTLVITSHVKEGVGIARRYKLPQCVVDGITQHHGTSLVSFFYHRARQQEQANGKGNGRAVTEENFRYEGPRPRRREMAILSLADAVEAAARAMEKPSPGRIEGLVEEIVDGKLRDGQLDESGLTLSELSEIKRSFVFTLANMLHVRIAYPQDENKTAEQPDKASATHAGTAPADTVAGRPGATETRGAGVPEGPPGVDGS